MPRFTSIIITCFLTALLAPTFSCEEFVGVTPPNDALHFPVGLAIHPTGRYLYVVNTNFDVAYTHASGGTVTVLDADTLQIVPSSTVTIGSFGGEAALSADGRHLWVTVRGDNSVVRLDVSEDGRTLSCRGGRDGLPCRVSGLSGDPYSVHVETYQAELEEGGTTRIDLVTIAHVQSVNITALSIKNEDMSTVASSTVELTSGGSAIAVHPRTGRYYSAGRFETAVRVFLPVIGIEGDVAAIYSLGNVALGNPTGVYDARDIAFTSDGDQAFVSARNPHSVLLVDTSPSDRQSGQGSRDEWVGQVDLISEPEGMAMVPEGDVEFLYVAEFGADVVTIIDPITQTIVGRFPVGNGPTEMVFDQTRHQRLYVTLFNESAVAVVDIDPDSPRYRVTVAKIR